MTELPAFVDWPVFPFEGELRVKALLPDLPEDFDREGEGGRPCRSCPRPDDDYLWVDEHWRVFATLPKAIPVVMLESRAHVDLGDLDEDRAAELGRLVVRIDRAMRASGEVGRTQVNRSGDGAAHLHVWFYGRPVGTLQLLGMGVPLWSEVLPPLPDDEWDRRILAIGEALAAGGGTLVGSTRMAPSRVEVPPIDPFGDAAGPTSPAA